MSTTLPRNQNVKIALFAKITSIAVSASCRGLSTAPQIPELSKQELWLMTDKHLWPKLYHCSPPMHHGGVEPPEDQLGTHPEGKYGGTTHSLPRFTSKACSLSKLTCHLINNSR